MLILIVRLIRLTLTLLIVYSFSYYNTPFTQAFGEVRIHEINYMGYTDWPDEEEGNASDEYIELQNTTGTTIDLTGYILRIVSGSTDQEIVLEGKIDDYLVIRRITQSQKTLPLLPKTFNTANLGSLSNTSGAFLELRDASGRTMDAINMLGKWAIITLPGESLTRQEFTWIKSTHSPGNPDTSINQDDEDIEISYQGLIRISEFLPDPIGVDTEGEYIELENLTDAPITLDGWKIDDRLDGGSQSQSISGTIAPRGFWVIRRPDLKLNLNNSSSKDTYDAVSLISPDGIIQEEVRYEFAGLLEGKSFSQIRQAFVWTNKLTPGSRNEITLEEEKPKHIIPLDPGIIKISEVYPYPEGGSDQEFIELYNSSNQSISLEGWILKDRSKEFILSGTIEPYQYRLLSFKETLIYLNNSTEDITLLDPEDNVYDTINLDPIYRNHSYSLIEGTYHWTGTPTPGIKNILNPLQGEDPNTDSESIIIDQFAELYELSHGVDVRVTGVILIPFDFIYARSFYISDQDRLIRVVMNKNDNFTHRLGDLVTIQGQWHQTKTQSYLKLHTSERIGTGDMKLNLQSSLDLGRIGGGVKISGRIEQKQGQNITIRTSKGLVTIKIPTKVQSVPRMRKSMDITVEGFIDLYRGKVRIIPWQPNQIRVHSLHTSNLDTTDMSLPSQALLSSLYRPWEEYEFLGINPEKDISPDLGDKIRTILTRYPWTYLLGIVCLGISVITVGYLKVSQRR